MYGCARQYKRVSLRYTRYCLKISGHLLIFDNVYFNYKITVKSGYNDQFVICRRNLINLYIALCIAFSYSLHFHHFSDTNFTRLIVDSLLETFTLSLLPLQIVRITYSVDQSTPDVPLGERTARRQKGSQVLGFFRSIEMRNDHGNMEQNPKASKKRQCIRKGSFQQIEIQPGI